MLVPIVNVITPALLNAAQIDNTAVADNSITDAKIDFGTGPGQVNTDDLPEGSTNLFFTDERVDDRVNGLLQAGSNITLTYDDVANTLTIAATEDNLANNSIFDLGDVINVGGLTDNQALIYSSAAGGFVNAGPLTTDFVPEGSTNQYYTDARAISAVENEATLDLSGLVTVTGNTANKTTTIGDFDALGLYDSTGVQVEGDDTSWAGISLVEYEGGASKPFPGFANPFFNTEVWGGSPGSTAAVSSGKRLFAMSGAGSIDNGGTIEQPAAAPVRMIMETTETQTTTGRGTKMYIQTTPTGSTTRSTTATFQGDNTTLINLIASGTVVLSNLPTSDPGNPGQLWNDLGTLKVS